MGDWAQQRGVDRFGHRSDRALAGREGAPNRCAIVLGHRSDRALAG